MAVYKFVLANRYLRDGSVYSLDGLLAAGEVGVWSEWGNSHGHETGPDIVPGLLVNTTGQ